MVTTKTFPKGAIICDYHGQIVPAAEARKRIADEGKDSCYTFFFKYGSKDVCIDAQDERCSCHPEMETVGRLIKNSRKHPNVRPVACLMNFDDGPRDTILFQALRDLKVNEELLFDHGLRRDSVGREGELLTWLDD